METILNYNFKSEDFADGNYDALYRTRRRDSIFAYVGKEADGTYYAVRDHLGIVPLFYTTTKEGVYFATDIDSLLQKCRPRALSQSGMRAYIALGSTRLSPLFPDIRCVPPGTVVRIKNDGNIDVIYTYIVSPERHAFFTPLSALVVQLEQLFTQALKRQLKGADAGLYLSGGIDSGLIGIYLKKLGVNVTTFTSATRGSDDDELPRVRLSHQLIHPVAAHIDYLAADGYEQLADALPRLYRQPIGNSTSLAICSMWDNTPIASQSQVFFGQNCDVINNAMDNNRAPLFGMVPRVLRGILHTDLQEQLDSYIRKETHGVVASDPLRLSDRYRSGDYTNFQLTALAGMYLRRTPVDSEIFTQPAINAKKLISNPYYDIDVVEFLLGLSIRHKIRFAKGGAPVSLDKRIMQALALRAGLPPEMVYRKKGFTVPRRSSTAQITFFEGLPVSFREIHFSEKEHRFAAKILQKYLHTHALADLPQEL